MERTKGGQKGQGQVDSSKPDTPGESKGKGKKRQMDKDKLYADRPECPFLKSKTGCGRGPEI